MMKSILTNLFNNYAIIYVKKFFITILYKTLQYYPCIARTTYQFLVKQKVLFKNKNGNRIFGHHIRSTFC